VFFGTAEQPLTAKESRFAKKICGACPVQRDCLITALRDGERFGVWAGLTSIERRRLLKDHSGDWKAALRTYDQEAQG
jgi:hypothetical protein